MQEVFTLPQSVPLQTVSVPVAVYTAAPPCTPAFPSWALFFGTFKPLCLRSTTHKAPQSHGT